MMAVPRLHQMSSFVFSTRQEENLGYKNSNKLPPGTKRNNQSAAISALTINWQWEKQQLPIYCAVANTATVTAVAIKPLCCPVVDCCRELCCWWLVAVVVKLLTALNGIMYLR